MRQIGNLSSEQQARTFGDYLLTREIESQVDQAADGWIVWALDEDNLEKARQELRALEYSQRLRHKGRVILGEPGRSNGRYLYDAAARGSAQAMARNSGAIDKGRLADLVAIDDQTPDTYALKGDFLIDAWIFASDDALVTDTWSAGRHMVKDGAHIHRTHITGKFLDTIQRLRNVL